MKPPSADSPERSGMSPPTWGRGLKLEILGVVCSVLTPVAPHVGAWIETWARTRANSWRNVAPHVGAWIETRCNRKPPKN